MIFEATLGYTALSMLAWAAQAVPGQLGYLV